MTFLIFFKISLTENVIPWLFPDLENFSFSRTFSLTVATLDNHANSFDPDQDQQNFRPAGSKPFNTLIMFLKELFEKVNFENKWANDTKSM